jgi:hypothetical protein
MPGATRPKQFCQHHLRSDILENPQATLRAIRQSLPIRSAPVPNNVRYASNQRRHNRPAIAVAHLALRSARCRNNAPTILSRLRCANALQPGDGSPLTILGVSRRPCSRRAQRSLPTPTCNGEVPRHNDAVLPKAARSRQRY